MRDIIFRILVVLLFVALFIIIVFFSKTNFSKTVNMLPKNEVIEQKNLSPLSIPEMRKRKYQGSKIVIETELEPEVNFKRYVASYISDGLKIYGLLTLPTTPQPKNGYPAIIFNHGYIPPEEYQTTERYATYQNGFARSGYVTFKSDYRGHGNSEGNPEGAYFSPAYTVDVLNALSSVKKLSYVNPDKIGMWGHSLGGNITQRAMVIDPSVKAGVIWGGVVGSYKDMYEFWWNRRTNFSPWQPSTREQRSNRPSRQRFVEEHGQPTEDSEFWNSISPTAYLKDISGPIQLHHGLSDETVPFTLSQQLNDKLEKEGKKAELYFYPGNDHNISQSFNLAMERSIGFFDRYLK